MVMLTEAIELTLFPAMMAFAASSDLLTMTIANRVSLILVAGFVVLALLSGITGAELVSHLGAMAVVLAVAFFCFACGWIGGGDAKLAAATALWLGFGHLFDYLVYASLLGGALTVLIVQFRTMPLPPLLGRPGLGGAAAPGRRRRSLRHRARGGGALGLSADPVDDGARPLASCAGFAPLPGRVAAFVNARLTRFGYASLTML